jgi:hypothetical protein
LITATGGKPSQVDGAKGWQSANGCLSWLGMTLRDEVPGSDELWGVWDGQCQACDLFGRVNDLGLCEDCATKLERDLIRQRDWDYSALAFGLPSEAREELRRQVIAQYGETL